MLSRGPLYHGGQQCGDIEPPGKCVSEMLYGLIASLNEVSGYFTLTRETFTAALS